MNATAEKIKADMAARHASASTAAAPAAAPAAQLTLDEISTLPRETVVSMRRAGKVSDSVYLDYLELLTAAVDSAAPAAPQRKPMNVVHDNGYLKPMGCGTTFPRLLARQLACLAANPAAILAALPSPDSMSSRKEQNSRTKQLETQHHVDGHPLGRMVARVEIGTDTHAANYRADYAALQAIVAAITPAQQ